VRYVDSKIGIRTVEGNAEKLGEKIACFSSANMRRQGGSEVLFQSSSNSSRFVQSLSKNDPNECVTAALSSRC
jgi:hypothetical protein